MQDISTPMQSDSPANGKRGRSRPTLAHFPHRLGDVVRYRDMDVQGHVNNALYSTYFESGRVALLRAPDLSTGVLHGTFALVRAEIDFMRELRWPEEITIGSGIAEFGNRSFVMQQAIFQGEDCAAAARMVLVLMDEQTRRPIPLTPDLIARLSPYKLQTE
jgi:acyl-CoA thioester hydrolase